MAGGHISKIERIHAPKSPTLWVDLCLNKRNGVFFANVGGERIEAATKAEAVERTEAALSRITNVAWRQVIILRVYKRNDEEPSQENGLNVFSAKCSFTYMRRERASNPLVPNQEIERDHPAEFEEWILEQREREAYFASSKVEKKKRADEREADLRQQRAALTHVKETWARHVDDIHEYELPYTEEAWAGIQRLAEALRITQEKLDNLAASATPEKLAHLAGAPLLLLNGKGKK